MKPGIAIIAVIVFFASCSTAPKRPAEIFKIQSMTDTLIGLANKEADQGNYEASLKLLDEAWRLAVTTDRPTLRIRVNMGRANALYALGRADEAERIWRDAEIEATFGEEPMLASACRIYRARSTLISGKADTKEVLALVEKEIDILKPDKLFYAMAWTVKGMAEKDLGRFEEAEKSVMNALSIHEKGRYLEQAAYDWYLIASIRSVNENYREAVEALNKALNFDRRAENTFGLAMDWAALGDVFAKTENNFAANLSWRRAVEIFRAMEPPKEANAKDVESRIKPLPEGASRTPRMRD